jgi:23S rRNA pseudouridine955/2504/2580 synthase
VIEHAISADESGQRVDKLVRRLVPDVPLSGVYKMIRTRRVRVNGKRTQVDYLLQAGDVVEIRVAVLDPGRPRAAAPRRFPPVPVLFEDEAILAVDKPAGMAVHPGTGITGGTLVDWARQHLGVDPASRDFKPSPAHRLDRETSGVVLVAKKRKAMVRLTEIFTEGGAVKSYLALVMGRIDPPAGTIDVPLAEHQQTSRSRLERGVNLQRAVTHHRTLARGAGATLVECTIETGRTHQIRRHLAAVGNPVAGDAKYGDFEFNRRVRAAWGLKRQFLHARRLSIPHPVTGATLVLEAPLPDELMSVLRAAGVRWP